MEIKGTAAFIFENRRLDCPSCKKAYEMACSNQRFFSFPVEGQFDFIFASC